MSVYSGFATRQLESQYNKLLVSIIKILQRRVVKFYKNEKADESAFKSVVQQVRYLSTMRQTILKMNQMEHQKYNEPYYSAILNEICELLSIPCNQIPADGSSFNRTFLTSDFLQPQPARIPTAVGSRKTSTQISKPIEKLEKFQFTPPTPTQTRKTNTSFMHRQIKSQNTSFESHQRSFYSKNYPKPQHQRPSVHKSTQRSTNGSRANPNESFEERSVDFQRRPIKK